MKDKQVFLLEQIRRTLQWVKDVSSGEIIESRLYHRHYLGFENPISSKDLNIIVKSVNSALAEIDFKKRVKWNMSEIIIYTLYPA